MIKIENAEVCGFEHAVRGCRNPKNSWHKSDSAFSENKDDFVLGENDLKLMTTLVKAGTTRDSCSFMHKGVSKPFELSDFTTHYQESELSGEYMYVLENYVIETLNDLRQLYLETKDSQVFQQIRCLLPCGYNQRYTWTGSYENLYSMYHQRKNHKLDEWREFCAWIETLPYAKELIVEN